MDFKLSVLLLVACATGIYGIPIKTEDVNTEDVGEYGEYFQGDIVLNEEQMSSILYSNKRNGRIQEKYRWPGNLVFYEIAHTYDQAHVKQIEHALKEIEKVTCIRFHPKTATTKNYIHVDHSKSGCFSAIGKSGGKQTLNLQKYSVGVGCFKLGTIMHEFIHALGFYHQQSASDRDNYVTIIKENIKEGKEHNFVKYPATLVTDFGVQYDYGSIMHYSATAFTKNGKMTIVPHDKTAKIGQRQKMSDSDIKKINLMYKCPQV
uniref:Metalloendopeptidase n=1 Tax=Dolopus genitalis TaxID=2488630 RepID=A0A3G5BIP2_DOLGE|nr:venom polypeptide [Dolopus genitalis]